MALALGATVVTAQTVVYEDDFNADSSGTYSSFSFENDTFTEISFAYDFGTDMNGFGVPIPPAPNSAGGDTKALRLSANILADDFRESFCGVYTPQSFSGDYQVFVDFYGNVLSNGGVGTTNHLTVGINHGGDKFANFYQWYGSDGSPERELIEDSDGYMFSAAFDDGDGSRDFGMTEGTPGIRDWIVDVVPGDSAAEPPLLAVIPDHAPTWFTEVPVQGWQARGAGAEATDIYRSPEALIEGLTDVLFTEFGDPPADINQAPANAWHQLRIDYIGGVVTVHLKSSTMDTFTQDYAWLQIDADGFVKLVQYDDPDDTYTSGKVMLGFEDGFSSFWGEPAIAGVEWRQYVLYDNLRVVQIGEPTSVPDWSVF